jgi:predicted site-specific integrase-resolvase
MPTRVNGTKYYRTAEACQAAGISKNTFLRWVRNGVFPDVERRDRRGWRIFTEIEMEALLAEANKISMSR